jgi:hypothetical protein
LSNFAQEIEVKNEFSKKATDMKTDIQAISKTMELLSTGRAKKTDPRTYQILGIDHNAAVENWYILIKDIPVEKGTLEVFVRRFRDEYCKKESNINLVDDAAVYPLITTYPLEGKNYLTVADSFIAMALFDSAEVWMYPFQDAMYRDLGGKGQQKNQ